MNATERVRLWSLSDLAGFEVADGFHDIRGWALYDEEGRRIGEIRDLLVDPALGTAGHATIDLADAEVFRHLCDNEANAWIPLLGVSLDPGNAGVRLHRPLAALVGASAVEGPAAGHGIRIAARPLPSPGAEVEAEPPAYRQAAGL